MNGSDDIEKKMEGRAYASPSSSEVGQQPSNGNKGTSYSDHYSSRNQEYSPESPVSEQQSYAPEEDMDLGLNNSNSNDDFYNWKKCRRNEPLEQPKPAQSTQPIIQDRPTGLRHFSTKVCEKVKEKGLTNYNEVADELVAEYFDSNMIHQVDKQEYDMKNIRRRVYDALNVLLAMNIITKNKKDIRWLGLPASSAQEITRLEEEKKRREEGIKSKLEALQENIVQLVAYKNLIQRNRDYESVHGRPDKQSLLALPFLIVNTHKTAMVDCSVSSDKSEYLFSFDKPFEIQDDLEVLKKLGMACGLDNGTATPESIEHAKTFLPPLIRPYVNDILSGYKRLLEEREQEQKRLEALKLEQERRAAASAAVAAYELEAQQNNNSQQQFYDPETIHDDDDDVQITSEHTSLANTKQYVPPVRPIIRTVPPTQRFVQRTISNVPTASNSPNAVRQRYYVQKAPVGTIRREVPLNSRTVTRTYVTQSGVPVERRVVSGAPGQPVKYYLNSSGTPQAAMQQSATPTNYKYVSAPHRVMVRPPPPPPGRVVYTPQTQRLVQQRVVTQHPSGTTVVRKIVKRVVVPPRPANAVQMVKKPEMEKVKIEMPMSSRQSDMLQPQGDQHEQQYDQYYDEQMEMGNDQMLSGMQNDMYNQ